MEFRQKMNDPDKQELRPKMLITRKQKGLSRVYGGSGDAFNVRIAEKRQGDDIHAYSGSKTMRNYGSSPYTSGSFGIMDYSLLDIKFAQLNHGVDTLWEVETWEAICPKWFDEADATESMYVDDQGVDDTNESDYTPWMFGDVNGSLDLRQHPTDSSATQSRMKLTVTRSRLAKNYEHFRSQIGMRRGAVTLNDYGITGELYPSLLWKYKVDGQWESFLPLMTLVEDRCEQVKDGVNVLRLTELWQGYSAWIPYDNTVELAEE